MWQSINGLIKGYQRV